MKMIDENYVRDSLREAYFFAFVFAAGLFPFPLRSLRLLASRYFFLRARLSSTNAVVVDIGKHRDVYPAN